MIREEKQNNLILELFPQCNNNCKFCFQDRVKGLYEKAEKKGTKKDKIEFINEAIEAIKKLNRSFSNVAIWGGELFFDRREEYTNKIKELFKTIDLKGSLEITTNGLEITELYDFFFLEEHPFNCELSISFNPVNMLSPLKKEIQKQNIKTLKEKYKLEKVGLYVVLQEEVLKQECDLSDLDELYKDESNEIGFGFLQPGEGLEYSEEVRKNFNELYFNLLKRYPKSVDVKKFYDEISLKERENTIACFCHDEGSVFLSYCNGFKYIEDSTCNCFGEGSKYLNEVMNKFNCKECPYFKQCSDVCCTLLVRNKLLDSCYQKYLIERLGELKDENDTI